jgi:hypothetical protein
VTQRLTAADHLHRLCRADEAEAKRRFFGGAARRQARDRSGVPGVGAKHTVNKPASFPGIAPALLEHSRPEPGVHGPQGVLERLRGELVQHGALHSAAWAAWARLRGHRIRSPAPGRLPGRPVGERGQPRGACLGFRWPWARSWTWTRKTSNQSVVVEAVKRWLVANHGWLLVLDNAMTWRWRGRSSHPADRDPFADYAGAHHGHGHPRPAYLP